MHQPPFVGVLEAEGSLADVVTGVANGQRSALLNELREVLALDVFHRAIVPAAIFTLTAATLFAKNLYRPLFAPSMTDGAVARLARVMVVVLSLISLVLAIYSSTTLVSLLLLGYAGVGQFFPGVVFALFWNRVTTVGVFAGIIAGIGVLVVLVLAKRDPFLGLNAGFCALCINFVVTSVLSLLSPIQRSGFEGSQAS